MLHLQPVSEEKASEEIKIIYQDIKEVFDLHAVPLVFQYIANFENYLPYLWEQLRMNMTTHSFASLQAEVIDFADAATARLYNPDSMMLGFISQLHPSEKEHINQTVLELTRVNSSLNILLIAVRESLKGVMIGTPLLGEGKFVYQTKRSEVVQNTEEIFVSHNTISSRELTQATNLLAPLFGGNALIISRYPDFFSKIAQEMEKLVNKEVYLQERVELEKVTLRTTERFPRPLENSYKKLVELASGKPYFAELLYLLCETFPSQFPRLVMTSAVMKHALRDMSQKIKNL